MAILLITLVKSLLEKRILTVRHRTFSGTIRRLAQQWTFYAIRKLGLKVITSKEILEGNTKYRVFPFNGEEQIVLAEPANGSDNIREITNMIGTHSLKQPFVAEVKNAEIVGYIAVGFDEDSNIISDTITGNPECIKYISAQTLLLQKIPIWPAPQLDTVCSLVNWNGGYFHWLMDCLTRIEGLDYYQKQTGVKSTLIIHANPSEWQKETLRFLGYNPDDCIQWNGSKIQVKRLVVPSFRREHNIISPKACQWVRQRMLSHLPDDGGKTSSFASRILISRPEKVGRNIINEDEVMAALAPLGFVAYTMEELSFADEVRLFSQAEIVVAPHGAGLTNIIFAPQNLIVVDLFGSFGTPCFFALAQALGFHYGCLGTGFDPKNKTGKYTGIMVNVAKLQALVEEMLNTRDSDRQLVSVEETLLPTGDDRAA